jgi:hypothetical protein
MKPTHNQPTRMQPTRIRDLFAIFALLAVGVRLMAARLYPVLAPPFLPSAPVSLFLVAALEGYTAAAIRARLDGRRGTRPIMPIIVARHAALAKASSLVGAVAGGVWTGLFAFVVTHRDSVRYAGRDAVVSGFGVAASVLLTAAALYLERACRADPPPPERDDDTP